MFILGYIGEFEIVDDHRSGKIVVQLNGRLNKAGVISPRYNVQVSQIENWVNLLLPARSFGIIILVSHGPCSFPSSSSNVWFHRPPHLVSSTTKRLVAKTLEESSSAMSTK